MIVCCEHCNKEIEERYHSGKLVRFCSLFCMRKNWKKLNKEKKAKHDKNYYKKNKEKINKYRREYFRRNKDSERKSNKEWIKKNKKKNRNYHKDYNVKRRKIDENFNMRHRLRTRLKVALEKYGEGKKVESSKYGIDFKKIMEHLKPFPKDISKYHIDHIKPLCTFDLTKRDEIIKAFAPENHQWLLAKDNLKKGGKF